MCHLAMEKIWTVLLACLVFLITEVATEKSGYSAIVSFSQNVKSRDGMMLLENMKSTFEDASDILYNAIGRQFIKVIFKIPDYWDTTDWNITIDDSISTRSDKADVLIDGTNNVVFGKFPFAQQYGSCGTPGHQIIIPTAFFSEANTFPKGTTLSREWLKYRYGVFDENGYAKDPLYPLYYTLPGNDPNEIKINECTNSPVIYNFTDQSGADCSANDPPLIDRLNSKECSIMPDKESLEAVTSSLLYFQQDILNMQHVCGKDPDHKHNAISPNKHNAMCRGQSVWDIVKLSEDFREETDSEEDKIEYVYVQETKPKVIVAWENTAKVNKIKGAIILNSIKRFIYDLPSGSKFNGFPFSSTLSDEKDYTLKELNDLSDKNNIMVNIKSDFVKDTDGDINLALSKALDIFSSSPEPEGTIILVTKSSGILDESLLESLQKSKVCVMLLHLSEGAVSDEVKNYVSALPCGSLEDISLADSDEDMFNKLFATMITVLPATVDDKTTQTVKTGYLSKESSITLQVDQSAETVIFWVFTDKESENFELKFNKMNQKLKVMKTTDVMALSFTPRESGSIEFSYPHETDPLFTQVRVISKAGKYLKAHILTHDTSENSTSDQMPIIIYAIVRYGAYPVQNAKVTATIERPNEESVSLEMFDDGRGDPDITQNDGIYSRYFTQFSEKGEYTVTVTVESEDLTSYGVDGNAGYQTCCGSFIKSIPSKVPAISKEFKTTFIAKSGRPDNGYKPSRILDLKIDKITDDKIFLTWSAPGEEGDSGTASRYEIKLFCEEENTTDCDIFKMIRVMNLPSPLNYGRKQEVTIQILIRTHIMTVGIIAYNSEENVSDLSNTVQINGISETIPEVTSTNPETSPAQRSSEGAIIGGTIVGILVLCAILSLIYYSMKKSQYRKPKDSEIEQNINTKDEVKITFKPTNPPIKLAPMKRIESFPVLLYTHDQIKDRKAKEKDPPLYGADIPPKPWASLDVISSVKMGDNARDAKSLSSSSTIDISVEQDIAGIEQNNQ